MRRYTELEKIRARNLRRAWWENNKQNLLDFFGLLAFGVFGWSFWCLLCFMLPYWP